VAAYKAVTGALP